MMTFLFFTFSNFLVLYQTAPIDDITTSQIKT